MKDRIPICVEGELRSREYESQGVRPLRDQPCWSCRSIGLRSGHCTNGIGESAPVFAPVSSAAIENDKRGEIAQERLIQPALTCV